MILFKNYPSLSAQMRANVPEHGDKYEKLAEEIRNFLAIKNGQAKTKEILDHFKVCFHKKK